MILLIATLLNLSGKRELPECSEPPPEIHLFRNLVACFLSVWYGRRNYPNSSSPLLEIFYIDGTIYFVVMGGSLYFLGPIVGLY